MTLPTANEIMSLYLYGEEELPVNLVSDSIIRSDTGIEKHINLQECTPSGQVGQIMGYR
jgi:hypothetical protein